MMASPRPPSPRFLVWLSPIALNTMPSGLNTNAKTRPRMAMTFVRCGGQP